ncbi:MobF family relaxase [Morganella morganii]|uniref:MobF family relaxase n=1 Tax=Morganella morganii TaxID=582 RepID=UPI0037512260
MLSLSRIGNAAGAASYYEQKDNYYFLGDAATEWFGKGAEKLGLTGNVKQQDFINILDGNLPTGETLAHMVNGKNKHRAGWDLTFSAPKSASVLALVNEDKAVLDAHRNAVTKTLTMIEKMASSRIMEKGISGVEETGNITAALFIHDTNRNLEPHLHTHAILTNITETQSGKWKTLSADAKNKLEAFTEIIWQNPVALGSIYRQFFKADLKEQGYSFIEAGKNGQWEIAGVPTDEFSSRHKEIIDSVGENATAKEKSIAAKDTRKKKDFTNINEVRKEWKKTLESTGFNQSEIKANNTEQLNIEAADNGDVKKIIRSVIHGLEKQSAKFTYDKLLSNVINTLSTDQFSDLKNLRENIKNEIDSGYLVPLNKEGTLHTTIFHLKNETSVIKSVTQLNNKNSLLKTQDNSSLSRYLTADNGSFKSVSIIGGGSFLLSSVSKIGELATENERQHIIIAPSFKVKEFLKNNLEKNNTVLTVNEFLKDGGDTGKKLISLYQSENMKLDAVNGILNNEKKNDSVIVSIDSKTKNSEGLFTDVLKKAEVDNFMVIDKNENKKTYFINDVGKSDRVNLAAKQYMTLSLTNKDAIIQVGDDKTKNMVNEQVRNTLKDNGFLSDKKIIIRNESRVYLDESNRNLRNTYKKGFIVENIKDKTRSEIIEVDKSNNVLVMKNNDGKLSQLQIPGINGDYNLYEPKNLELREGEKIKTYKGFGNVEGNSSFSVVAIKKGNFIFGDRVIIENDGGERTTINPGKVNQFHYGYSETFGSSVGKERTVIALMNEKDISSTNLNKIKQSGDTIIAITGIDREKTEMKLNKADISISHIPTVNTNILETLKTINNLKNDTISDLDKALQLGIDKASSGKVFFNSAAAMMNVANLNTDFSMSDITDAMSRMIEQGELIPLTSNALTDNFIRKETLDNEVAIVRKIFEGKGTESPLLNGKVNFDNTHLTNSQKAAGELILKSKDKIIAIQGYAGVGKTTQFKTVAKTLAANRPDIELRGLAPTHKAVSELKSAGITSQTIASFIQDTATGESNQNFSNSVFIIDESSMTGNKTMLGLISVITENGGRIILSGDKDQLKSFDTGSPFKLTLERSAIDHVVMNEIVRQSPELKPAVEAIIKGNLAESLEVIKNVQPGIVPRENSQKMPVSSVVNLRGIEPERYTGMIVSDYMSRTTEARSNTMIITPINADRNKINEDIHAALSRNGDLGKSITVPTLQRVNSQEYDLRTQKFWSDNNDGIVKIGDTYHRIDSINNEGIISLVNTETGKESSLSLQELDSRKVAVYQERNIEISQGEKIRLTVTDRERNTFNNDTGTVKSIDGSVINVDFNGKEISFSPAKNMAERHLDYSYAITSYSSQGASVPYVIVYDGVTGGKRNLAALDNTYVELSRSKEHVQLYIDDASEWAKHIGNHSGVRHTAHDILNKADNIAAEKELSAWSESKAISRGLAEKLPEMLVDTARYAGKQQELLLAVHNEFGVHRGNYHIPVGVFTGNIDTDNAYYSGAADGQIIVLNKGDNNLDTVTYNKDEFDKAIHSENRENAIVINLSEPEQISSPDELLTKEDITIAEVLKEMSVKDSQEDTDFTKDEQKELLLDSGIESLKEIEKEKDITAEAEKEADITDNKQIRHDEENILRHNEKELIKDIDIQI